VKLSGFERDKGKAIKYMLSLSFSLCPSLSSLWLAGNPNYAFSVFSSTLFLRSSLSFSMYSFQSAPLFRLGSHWNRTGFVLFAPPPNLSALGLRWEWNGMKLGLLDDMGSGAQYYVSRYTGIGILYLDERTKLEN